MAYCSRCNPSPQHQAWPVGSPLYGIQGPANARNPCRTPETGNQRQDPQPWDTSRPHRGPGGMLHWTVLQPELEQEVGLARPGGRVRPAGTQAAGVSRYWLYPQPLGWVRTHCGGGDTKSGQRTGTHPLATTSHGKGGVCLKVPEGGISKRAGKS